MVVWTLRLLCCDLSSQAQRLLGAATPLLTRMAQLEGHYSSLTLKVRGGIQQRCDFSSVFQTEHTEKIPWKKNHNPQLTYSMKSLGILFTSDIINSAGLCHPNMKNIGFSTLESEKWISNDENSAKCKQIWSKLPCTVPATLTCSSVPWGCQ